MMQLPLRRRTFNDSRAVFSQAILKSERSITADGARPAEEEIDEPAGKSLRRRSDIAPNDSGRTVGPAQLRERFEAAEPATASCLSERDCSHLSPPFQTSWLTKLNE
jgi:hypothetical protein